MNKRNTILSTTLTMAIAVLTASPAMAAFVLNGTRFIYEEGKKSIPLEVTNNAKDTYGGQVWVENVSADKSGVFIVPSPPVFKVDAGKKQIIRLMSVNQALPTDRESLFWLNVQELPPKPKQTEGSSIAIAMNTKVKMIYRPKSLAQGRKDAEKQLTLVNKGTAWLKNPTPYYFAVIGVKMNGKEVMVPKQLATGLTLLQPYSEADIGLPLNGKVSVQAINDWGGIQDYTIQ
ncbi:fimbrial chaperone [Edwardsiella tarda]|uniref:fimbrial chaperone n=1 Tax=Edwardsiella tarda TaxID=636 RepID=UPI003D2EA301